ncbi:hypothetical protein Q7P37_001622 [Cladosporium fusiforme]
MRITTTPVALLALPALTDAIALIDFVPRVEKVSTDCRKVYEQKIPDCSESDFTGEKCSVSCVRGLGSMTSSVKEACGGEGIVEASDRDGQNILAAFLSDEGPQALCKDATDILADAPSSSAAAPTTSEEPSTTASPTPTSSPAEASSVIDSTATAPSSSTDIPTSLVMATSSTATDESGSTVTSASSQIFEAPSMPPTSSSASGSEATESAGHSGGGSPFDAAGNEFDGAATTTASSMAALAFAASLTVLAALW